MKPLVPVSPGARVALGLSFFALFFAVWSVATFGGFVPKIFLADPLQMLKSGWLLLTEMGFAHDIGMTVWRVVGGFAIAAGLALPLGVKDRSLISRVLIPGAAPEIAETLRMVLGWAWTYVIVAELIRASSGIGHMITDSQALLATDQIIFGIIVIGLIGLCSDLFFKTVNRRLFPWAQLGR